MEAYKRSLVRDVNQHEVWYLLGLVQAKAGDRGGARTSLEQSLKRNPNYSPARQALNDLR
jgi:Tfp pilus assembly protein PilF